VTAKLLHCLTGVDSSLHMRRVSNSSLHMRRVWWTLHGVGLQFDT